MMKQSNQEGLQVEVVVRKKPKLQPYFKHLKSGITKFVYEVTQEQMDAVVDKMIKYRSIELTNEK